MAKQTTESVLKEMASVLGDVVSIAERLAAVAHDAADEQTLKPLQAEQEELIAKVVHLDSVLDELTGGKRSHLEDDRSWKLVTQRLEKFEALNSEFLETLTIRQGLIQFNLQELRERKQDLKKVKVAYVAGKGGSKKTAKGARSSSKGSVDAIS